MELCPSGHRFSVAQTTQTPLRLGTLITTYELAVDEEANGMELDPMVIPIGAEIRSQTGDLIGRGP